MHFVSSFEGLDDRISSVARLKEKIHGAETGQFGSVTRLKYKTHRAEPGQIGSGQAKRQNTQS